MVIFYICVGFKKTDIVYHQAKLKFHPSIEWLDDFMRRFCLSDKRVGFYSKNMLKIKARIRELSNMNACHKYQLLYKH